MLMFYLVKLSSDGVTFILSQKDNFVKLYKVVHFNWPKKHNYWIDQKIGTLISYVKVISSGKSISGPW